MFPRVELCDACFVVTCSLSPVYWNGASLEGISAISNPPFESPSLLMDVEPGVLCNVSDRITCRIDLNRIPSANNFTLF